MRPTLFLLKLWLFLENHSLELQEIWEKATVQKQVTQLLKKIQKLTEEIALYKKPQTMNT